MLGTIRLTYQAQQVDSEMDGPALTEIEVTPAMIEAGEAVLTGTLGGAVSSFWNPDELAAEVFRAMVAAMGEPLR